MTERIDHAAEARRVLDNIPHESLLGNSTALAWGQVHATLALVEQQRIANLITIAGWVADSRAEGVGYDLDNLRTGVAGEVWERLGLS